jgi:hypothetical protein
VVKRARHHSYRVKRATDHGTRYAGPPTINLCNLQLAQQKTLQETTSLMALRHEAVFHEVAQAI